MRRPPWYLLVLVWGALFVWVTPALGRTAQLLSLASWVIPLLAAGYAHRGASVRGALGLAAAVALLFAFAVLHGRASGPPAAADAWVCARIAAQGLLAYGAMFAWCKRLNPRFGVGLALFLDGSVGFVPGWGVLFPRLHLVSLLSTKSMHFAGSSWSGAALWAMVFGYGLLAYWRRPNKS